MKKILAAVMVGVIVFALGACKSDEKKVGFEYTQGLIQQNSITQQTTPQQSVPQVPGLDTEDSSSAGQGELSLGTRSGNTYKNAFIGIGCDLSSDWTVYTDQQILEANNMAKNMVGEELKELLDNSQYVVDFVAGKVDGTNVNITIEKLPYVMSVDQYLVSAESMVKEALENMGCTNVNLENTSVVIDGKVYDGGMITANISGQTLYEKQVYINCNGYMAIITATSFNVDNLQTVFDCFYNL